MKYIDLEKLAEQGKLYVKESVYRNNTRRQYIWDKDYSEILEVKQVPYKVFFRTAFTFEMSEVGEIWKITKQDYINLIKSGAKIQK